MDCLCRNGGCLSGSHCRFGKGVIVVWEKVWCSVWWRAVRMGVISADFLMFESIRNGVSCIYVVRLMIRFFLAEFARRQRRLVIVSLS